jgi:hypothetical protein
MTKASAVQSGLVAAIVASTFTLVGADEKFRVDPAPYNPGDAKVRIDAAWKPVRLGPAPHALVLNISEMVAYPPGASATAVVTPVDARTVSHLAFDHKIGTHCTTGSPRWDVETTDGSIYAFPCAAGVRQVDLPALGWERITFSCADVQVLKGLPGSCPLGSAQTLSLLQIVHDEPGSTMLDNLDVNFVVMRGPGASR